MKTTEVTIEDMSELRPGDIVCHATRPSPNCLGRIVVERTAPEQLQADKLGACWTEAVDIASRIVADEFPTQALSSSANALATIVLRLSERLRANGSIGPLFR